MSYYTGLACFNTLITLFDLVESEIKSGNKLTSFETFILCLMRPRLGVSVIDLADRFQIWKSAAADTFLEILNIFLIKFTPLVIWPEHAELQMSMPMSFRSKLGCKITAIIDCFELFIDRPSNLSAWALTWSTYKSHNTVKFLIGVTPQGTTCFISKRWGGWMSDQSITENSNVLKYVQYGDVIMADRGFNIAECKCLNSCWTCNRKSLKKVFDTQWDYSNWFFDKK